MSKKQPEIVERELWDHYSELPNPAWYEYKEVIEKKNMKNENLIKEVVESFFDDDIEMDEYYESLGKKKHPDNIVYNEESDKFDANLKQYPTTVGSQKFEPIKVDRSDSIKADKYFQSRLNELKKGYNKLVDEYEWTSLVYKSNYSFQPILGEPYHLYDNGDKSSFLSLIEPTQWDKVYIGTFILLNNGKWEKV
jgi:hypothetical protein|tara:strand:- start:178 stop:759 length:582 start_codon:yes stop_codon:yes gene_type:complete